MLRQVLVVLLVGTSVWGQASGRITGSIIDASGGSIRDAQLIEEYFNPSGLP